MNRADRRAMGCRGGNHVRKNVPRADDGEIVTVCAACSIELEPVDRG